MLTTNEEYFLKNNSDKILMGELDLLPLVTEFWKLDIKTFFGLGINDFSKEMSGANKGYIVFEINDKSTNLIEAIKVSPLFKKVIAYDLVFNLDGGSDIFVGNIFVNNFKKVFGRKAFDKSDLIVEKVNNSFAERDELVNVYCIRFSSSALSKLVEFLKSF